MFRVDNEKTTEECAEAMLSRERENGECAIETREKRPQRSVLRECDPENGKMGSVQWKCEVGNQGKMAD